MMVYGWVSTQPHIHLKLKLAPHSVGQIHRKLKLVSHLVEEGLKPLRTS